MPTYAYACTVCDHRFDVQQSFTDDALTVCPECQGRLRKVFSSVGVVFKGSGFYRTDSRSGTTAKEKEPVGTNGSSAESAKAPAESGDGAKSKESAKKEPAKTA